jgi:hypothetical protein
VVTQPAVGFIRSGRSSFAPRCGSTVRAARTPESRVTAESAPGRADSPESRPSCETPKPTPPAGGCHGFSETRVSRPCGTGHGFPKPVAPGLEHIRALPACRRFVS